MVATKVVYPFCSWRQTLFCLLQCEDGPVLDMASRLWQAWPKFAHSVIERLLGSHVDDKSETSLMSSQRTSRIVKEMINYLHAGTPDKYPSSESGTPGEFRQVALG